jgi:hypothetical protein
MGVLPIRGEAIISDSVSNFGSRFFHRFAVVALAYFVLDSNSGLEEVNLPDSFPSFAATIERRFDKEPEHSQKVGA